VVPALSLPDGTLTGPAALALLGDLAAAAPAGAAVPAAAGPLVASGVG
jgi:hypothetical protein